MGEIQHLFRGGRGNIRLLGQVLGRAKAAQCLQPCAAHVGTKIPQRVQNKSAILAVNPQRIQLSVLHVVKTILVLFTALRVGWHLPVSFYIVSLVSGVLYLIIINVCGGHA